MVILNLRKRPAEPRGASKCHRNRFLNGQIAFRARRAGAARRGGRPLHVNAVSQQTDNVFSGLAETFEDIEIFCVHITSAEHQLPFQYDFTHVRNTRTQILRTGKFITNAHEVKNNVRMISTDLNKAFDSIKHKGLRKKLQNSDSGNNLIKVLENYLADRLTRSEKGTRGLIRTKALRFVHTIAFRVRRALFLALSFKREIVCGRREKKHWNPNKPVSAREERGA
ncbi:hypothetical protein EVAR_80091_1 [Eumeta japonica]|uniref:Uncharacterized protein n=1 Tax=Eumeta variegata TaxID=151549 RepID=A0A4C1UCZ3_EUMVA|nr:hypothetical protein EVAR_80091_1 [Eumeta japonica]